MVCIKKGSRYRDVTPGLTRHCGERDLKATPVVTVEHGESEVETNGEHEQEHEHPDHKTRPRNSMTSARSAATSISADLIPMSAAMFVR